MKIPLVDLKANYLSIKKDIDSAIQRVIDNTAFIMGENVKNFERNFAKFCNAKHAIGCSSGTSALHLALMAAEVGHDDEVITVPNTFIATTECITHVGATVKFIDVDPQTLLIDIDKIEHAITPQTKAIIVVHLYGQMLDMERIREIGKNRDLTIIEDSAQAHAAEFKGHQPGYYGDVATFSFFPAKNLGCFGDGGAVVTNDDKLAERIRLLVNHGRTTKYEHKIEGYNYRLDALQAAILDAKLPHLEKWTDLRRQHAKFYNDNLPSEVRTPSETENCKYVYYMYVIRTDKRNDLMAFLKEKDVSCGIHYPIPLHLQPAYSYKGYKRGDFPVAEKAAKEILSIPIYPEMTQEQLRYVVDSITEFFNI